jgi:hypothetical protein
LRLRQVLGEADVIIKNKADHWNKESLGQMQKRVYPPLIHLVPSTFNRNQTDGSRFDFVNFVTWKQGFRG